MTGPIFIGVDVGSTGVKVAFYNRNLSRPIATGHVAYVAHQPCAGISEHDGTVLYEAACGAIAQALRHQTIPLSSFEGLAVCGMISGAIPIGDDGEALAPYTTTLDQRANEWLMRGRESHGKAIGLLTGSTQPVLAAKMRWLETAQPAIYGRTAKVVTAGSFVGARLAGLDAHAAFIDPTYLWMTGLADVSRDCWSAELCSSSGIDRARLPTIVPSNARVGSLSAASAQRTGLPVGLPIFSGCGDQAAGYCGAGIRQPGIAVDVAGTYAAFGVAASSFNFDETEHYETVKAATSDLWITQSFVAGGGLNAGWFLRSALSGLPLTDDATSLERLRDTLEQEAAAIPAGSEGLLFAPHLGGEALPPRPATRGAWIGLNWVHQRGHLYRGLLEGIAFTHRASLARRQLAANYQTPHHVITYGGGARSRLWVQIKSDMLGLPFRVLDLDSPATRGCATLAAVAAGYDGVGTDEEALYPDNFVFPNLMQHDAYSKLAENFDIAMAGLNSTFQAMMDRADQRAEKAQ